MALVGIAAIVFAKRRDEGRALTAHRPTLRRDLLFFLTMLTLALGAGALGLVPPLVLAPLFVLAYVGYVALTLRRGGETESEDELPDLVADPDSSTPPANWRIGAQFVVSLALIVGGAHVFVEELLVIAERLDASPLVLSLLLAPLATELPEKANSVLWIRDGKDSLALGNITGAMVFQSTIPVSVGLAFTDWELDRYALLAGALALTGALIALWSLSVRRRFTLPAVGAWTLLFLGLVAALVLT